MPECLCTMRLSRALYPSEFRHNLDSLAARLAIKMPVGRHRAMPDVLMTAQALLVMLKNGDISTMDHLRKLAGKKSLVA